MEPKPFEFQKDLVTATLKKRRDKLLKKYKVTYTPSYQPGNKILNRRVTIRQCSLQVDIDHLYGKLVLAMRS